MLEHLGGKELLSLRRVCKTTKNLIFKYTPSAMQEFLLEIQPGSNGSKTFDAVVRSGLPVTNIFINNGNSGYGGMDIYTSPGIPEFTNTYGGRIRTLKVQNFSTFICSAEFKFFESLVNLKELSIEVMDARNRPTGNSIQYQFPANFENLKVLKFGQILDPSKRPFKTRFQWDLIDACPRLEYLVLPLTERELEEGLDTADDPWFFMMVVDYLNNQRANGIPPLKTLDLAHFAGRHFGTASFAPFMDSISGLANKGLPFPDIQLKNLHAEHLQYYAFDIHRRRMQEHIFENRHIISLIDVVPRLQGLNLPNLETIRISSSMRLLEIVCHLDIRKMAHKLPFPVPDGIFNDWVRPVIGSGLPDWPMLKTLFIVFDGIKGDPKKFKWIFDFVFKVKERKSVENLSLVFTPQVASIPSLAQIVTCKTLARNFGNVKVLEIFGWQVNNTGYVHLWEGLGQLEELTIGYCPNFGGSALFGKNPDEPTFLKLKRKT